MNEELFDFGEALRALKTGRRVYRMGWNGVQKQGSQKGTKPPPNMYLFLLDGNKEVPKHVVNDPALKQVVDTEFKGDTFEALPSIRMLTADKKILTGWLASQTDMLAEDWVIL